MKKKKTTQNTLLILKQHRQESQVGDNKPHTTKYLHESEVRVGSKLKKKKKKAQMLRTTGHVPWYSILILFTDEETIFTEEETKVQAV